MIRNRRKIRSAKGTTLVETVVSTVIVGVLLVAALQAVGQSFLAQALTANRVQGEQLARSLLSEILQKAYQEPGSTNPPQGLDGGETSGVRSTYDDADDYSGLSESPPALASGAGIPAYAGWTRTVAITWIDPATLATSGAETGAKRFTVSLTKDGVPVASAVGYRANVP